MRKQSRDVVKVLGDDVKLINGTMISKRDAQRVLSRHLGVTDRQARGSVSSYGAEGWTLEPKHINDPLSDVNSFSARAIEQSSARPSASARNGRKGGRPRRDQMK